MLFDRFEKLVVSQTDRQWSDDVAFGVEGGGINLPVFSSSSLPQSPHQGMIVFDFDLKKIRIFDGDQWQSLTYESQSGNENPIIQLVSWYKNDIDVVTPNPDPLSVTWNRFSDGTVTDGQSPSQGMLPFTFKKSNSGIKIELTLTMGVNSNSNGYVYTFVEFSKDNGQTWNPIEVTPPFFKVWKEASLGWDFQGQSQMNMFTENWSLTRTKLGVQQGDQWLFRVNILSPAKIIINGTVREFVTDGATGLSSFTLMEIQS
jgi:hypothetical protein